MKPSIIRYICHQLLEIPEYQLDTFLLLLAPVSDETLPTGTIYLWLWNQSLVRKMVKVVNQETEEATSQRVRIEIKIKPLIRPKLFGTT